MEMQQIIGMLARMDANMKTMQERMDASQAKVDANTTEMKEMYANMKSKNKCWPKWRPPGRLIGRKGRTSKRM
jgi:hypothetical protein